MTTYCVCPQCRHVHAARTIPALSVHIWQVASRLAPPGGTIRLVDLELAANVSYATVRRHVARLAEVGLMGKREGERFYRVLQAYAPERSLNAGKESAEPATRHGTIEAGETQRSPSLDGETSQGAAVTS